MKFVVLLLVFVFSSTVCALGISQREKLSKAIMTIYQQDCKVKPIKGKETSEIKESFELTAIYIMHGEYNNMKEELLNVKLISNDVKCKKSIDDFLKLL